MRETVFPSSLRFEMYVADSVEQGRIRGVSRSEAVLFCTQYVIIIHEVHVHESIHGFPLISPVTVHTQSVRAADRRGHYHLSCPIPNPIGIFKGSSLGPLLFQIFADDFSIYTPQAHVVQYADDTQILISGKKRIPPIAHCYHGTVFIFSRRLVPLSWSENKH